MTRLAFYHYSVVKVLYFLPRAGFYHRLCSCQEASPIQIKIRCHPLCYVPVNIGSFGCPSEPFFQALTIQLLAICFFSETSITI